MEALQFLLLLLARTLNPLEDRYDRTLIGLWSVKRNMLLTVMADAPARSAAAQSSRLPAPLEAIHVSEAAEAGDRVAVRILDRAVRAFAAAVVSIVDVFNPDRVIVGGGIAIAWGDRLLDPARAAIEATAFRVQAARARVVPAELGDDTGPHVDQESRAATLDQVAGAGLARVG